MITIIIYMVNSSVQIFWIGLIGAHILK